MNESLAKQTPLKLDAKDYSEVRQRVLERDNWRCQFCGSMQNLEVHHQQYRSHSGSDLEDNLITLCNSCHRTVHLDQSE